MMEIHEQLYWEHLGVAGALAVSVFVLLGLLLRLRNSQPPRMHIWAMIAFFAVNTVDAVNSFAYSDVFSAPNTFFRWNDVIIPGFLVSLYFFVRALTSSAPRLHRNDVVHILPFVLGLLCLAPALLLPGDVRRGVVDGAVSQSYRKLIDTGETAFWSLWIAILVIYGALCIRRLTQHKRNIRDVFSDLEGKTLRSLDGLVGTILILALIAILDEMRQLAGYHSIRGGIWSLIYTDIRCNFACVVRGIRIAGRATLARLVETGSDRCNRTQATCIGFCPIALLAVRFATRGHQPFCCPAGTANDRRPIVAGPWIEPAKPCLRDCNLTDPLVRSAQYQAGPVLL